MVLNEREEKLRQFVDGYIKCLYWAEDLDDEPMMAQSTMFCLFVECQRFLEICSNFTNNPIPEDKFEQAGHDFWLTRNGHGSGFWDKPEIYGEKNSQVLTEISKEFGQVWTYISDDGHLEIM